MKKHITIFSLIVALVFAFNGVVSAQTEQAEDVTQPHEQQQGMMPSHMMQSEMTEREETSVSDLPSMLEQMSENLAQENVTPEMLKQMSEQLKQMAQMMKQTPGMMGSGNVMPPMMGRQQMPMMGNMMGQMPMMHESHESESTGLKFQMQGEMLKAMGEIMMKYGKLLAEESALEE